MAAGSIGGEVGDDFAHDRAELDAVTGQAGGDHDPGLRGFKTPVHAAARWYSWMSPPSRSRRSILSEGAPGWCGPFGCEQREPALGPLVVGVRRVAAEHVLELAAAEDEEPVEALGADGAADALG